MARKTMNFEIDEEAATRLMQQIEAAHAKRFQVVEYRKISHELARDLVEQYKREGWDVFVEPSRSPDGGPFLDLTARSLRESSDDSRER